VPARAGRAEQGDAGGVGPTLWDVSEQRRRVGCARGAECE
jgi:hypothetical protein